MSFRFEVAFKNLDLDSRSQALQAQYGSGVFARDIFLVNCAVIHPSELEAAAKEIVLDPILHEQTLTPQLGNIEGELWERFLHPGMTDNRARTFKEALILYFPQLNDQNCEVLSGDLLFVPSTLSDSKRIESKWVNPWIQSLKRIKKGSRQESERFHPAQVSSYFKAGVLTPPVTQTVSLGECSASALAELSAKKLYALSLEEMRTIQNYFKKLNREPTDVEMEILAQTWSEHCKHKIFGATVLYQGIDAPDGNKIPAEISSLYKSTVQKVTRDHAKPWLLSVFKDNAGVVAFSEHDSLCMKVETHNSPSALDPFGGAITGIVGVNRDILGTGIGAKPIFNTNVFCVGPTDYAGALPEKIHHPKDILEGVREGVEAGGNQSGIPTVNGAVVFDESFMGKPLIFVGSGGWMPRKIAERPTEEKKAFAGDLIYMVGGRIGKDGIHGATFSSLAMDDHMPSSVVQLGDPITQKRMSDFLLKARDQSLIQAITDNGAGGLSSSVGEIAGLTGGAQIDLAHAKTKYPGMAAWELMVSESQERMTVVIRPTCKKQFEDLAKLYQVEFSLLGTMTDSGFLDVQFHGKTVARLELEFLHEQCPRLSLKASWNKATPSGAIADEPLTPFNPDGTKKIPQQLKQLLSRPNIASKEWIIRQYDHEVQGCSVIKPLQKAPVGNGSTGASPNNASPNNAGVQRINVSSNMGVVVSCGLNPSLSTVDPYWMAQAAVDEAVRNALCVGAEFSTVDSNSVFALIDNFCWPDPTQDTDKMGALVRACMGMMNAATALKLPFISGKDSMKNDYKGSIAGKPVHISVLPTLLVTAIARIKNVELARSSEFKDAGDLIYLLGNQDCGLQGSEWARMQAGSESYTFGKPNWNVATQLYNWLGSSTTAAHKLKSLHDLSDGGLLVALAECTFAKNLGAQLVCTEITPDYFFGEGFHRFVATVSPHEAAVLENDLRAHGVPFQKLGTVTLEPKLEIMGRCEWSVPIQELAACWAGGQS